MDGTFDDDLLQSAMDGAKAINRFVTILYSEDAWLSPEQARLTGELVCRFLRRYDACAKEAFHQQRTLFGLPPKLHVLHHMGLDLLEAGAASREALNPLVFSTQMSEDLVGRPSRLSRRVSTRTTVMRVLQRYLQAAYKQWVASKMLVESK